MVSIAEESISFDWKPDQFIVVATQLMWIDIEAESSHISLLPPNSHRPQKCLGCSDMLHKDGATMLVRGSSHSFKSHNQTHIHDEIKHHWILYKGIIESLANYFLCTRHSDIVCRCETSWCGWKLLPAEKYIYGIDKREFCNMIILAIIAICCNTRRLFVTKYDHI